MDDNTPAPDDATDPTDPTDPDKPNRTRTWVIRIAVGVVLLIALVYGAIFFYVNVINDSPDALDEGDLTEAIADTTPPDTADPAGTAPADTEPTADTAAPAATTTAPAETTTPGTNDGTNDGTDDTASLDGVWTPTEASEFGYRVDEVLAGVNVTAVGRSNEIEGTLVIDGSTAEIDVTVQIENITSDDSRRDGQFRGRIMEADEFPEATFVSTEPIEFGAIPADGEQVVATATGELTLKDVTRTVTFELTAETNGERIGVFGNIPILFEDYGIDNPSFGAVTTEDNGLLEFVLVFEPA